MLERERAKLDRSLSGIREMKGLPDALLVIDVDHERIAVSEARKLGIPVVGVCDTNSSPDGIDYPIPGNDDALRAIKLYLGGAADAILEARAVAAPVIEGDANDYVEVTEEAPVDIKTEPEKSPQDGPGQGAAGDGTPEKASGDPEILVESGNVPSDKPNDEPSSKDVQAKPES
jgi:small subunit ribosomal protein S2